MNNMIELSHVNVTLSGRKLLNDINLTIKEKEIFAIVGGSGTGKTTLLRSILLLVPVEGSIKIIGKDILKADMNTMQFIRRQWGMMFQHGALFSSLTLLENVMFPMQQETGLRQKDMQELAYIKLAMVGLKPEASNLYPAELSGGMIKRAAIARALALDPKLLFLDEPTAGLDPHSASALDELILDLKSSLDLTVVMVSHDLDTLWRITDRLAFLGQGHVLGCAPINDLMALDQPLIKEYFSDNRAKMAAEKYMAE